MRGHVEFTDVLLKDTGFTSVELFKKMVLEFSTALPGWYARKHERGVWTYKWRDINSPYPSIIELELLQTDGWETV